MILDRSVLTGFRTEDKCVEELGGWFGSVCVNVRKTLSPQVAEQFFVGAFECSEKEDVA